MHKTLWTELGDGRRRSSCASSTTSTPRRASSSARSSGSSTRALSRSGDRGPLPDERAVARARGHARAARDRLPGDRRHEVLRARRDQGRDRLPDAARPTRRTRSASSASPTAPRRGHRPDVALARAHARRRRSASASGTRRPTPASVPGLGAAAIKALGRFMDTMEGLRARRRAAACRSATCSRRCSTSPATSTGSRPSARSRRRAAWRTCRSSSRSAREFDARAPSDEDTLDVFLQQVALVADADSRQDDEGLVTLMTLHNAKGLEYPVVFMIGLRGGGLPALALARRGRPRGGAAPLLRRRHARDAQPLR